jgi:hypothetical protein
MQGYLHAKSLGEDGEYITTVCQRPLTRKKK